MTTQIEQVTNDLLHFSGKFKVKKGKIKLNDGSHKKTAARGPRDKGWSIKSSEFAMKTHNPIRAIVDGLKIVPNRDKPMIALSIGENTAKFLFSWLCTVYIVDNANEKLRLVKSSPICIKLDSGVHCVESFHVA